MKILTKLTLGLAVVGSVALTSCKDNEDLGQATMTTAQVAGTLQSEIDAMKGTITTLQAQIDGIKSCDCTAVDLTDLWNAINQKISQDDLNAALADYMKSGDINALIQALNDRVDLTEQEIADLTARVVALETAVDDLKAAKERLEAKVLEYEQRISKLEVAVDNAATKAELAQAIADLGIEKYVTTTALIDYLKNYATKDQVTTLADQLNTLTSTVNDKADKATVETLYTTLTSLIGDKADKATVESLANSLTTLQTTKADKDYVDVQVAALQKAIDALESCGCDPSQYVLKAAYDEFKAATQKDIAAAQELAQKAYDKANDNAIAIAGLQGTVDTVKELTLTQEENIKDIYYKLGLLEGTQEGILIEINDLKDAISKIEEGCKCDLSNYYNEDEIDDLLETLEKDVNDSTERAKVEIETAYKAADAQLKKELNNKITKLTNRVSALETKVADLQKDLTNYVNALAKMVTGININEVNNPVFGSYNGIFTDLNSNVLIACYGEAAGAVEFPSSVPGQDALFTAKAGKVLTNGTGNAGYIHMTVNPASVDFTGLSFSLVNSKGQEGSVQLGKIQKSSKVLESGFDWYDGTVSKATETYSYVADATVAADDLNDAAIHLHVDRKAWANAFKEVINTNKSNYKTTLKDLAKLAITTARNIGTERYAVKCEYTDTLGEHAVLSGYDVNAIAVKPLAFTADDQIIAQEQKAFKQAKKTIAKLYNKVLNKAFKAAHLEKIQIRAIRDVDDAAAGFIVTVSYEGDEDIYTRIQDNLTEGTDYIVDADKKEIDVYMQADEADEILEGLALKDLANLLDAINTVLDKFESGSVLNKINEYIDKVETNVTKYTARLFDPIVFVNSDKGFGRAGIPGAPSVATGRVVIYPTTYSGGLLTPIFKKYIRVNGENGQLVVGNSIDITSQLKSGVNTIEYAALDYAGNEVYEVYEVNYK